MLARERGYANFQYYYLGIMQYVTFLFEWLCKTSRFSLRLMSRLLAPGAAKELALSFATFPRLVQKVKVFSFPIRNVDYLRNYEVQTL